MDRRVWWAMQKKRVGYYLEPNNNKIQLSWKS